jgi:uncharacterized integral membrane protein
MLYSILAIIPGAWLLVLVCVFLFSALTLYSKKEIPLKYRINATFQWVAVLGVLLIAYGAGLFMAFLAVFTAKKMKNAFGEIEQEHSEEYKAQGSSHLWEYWASPIPFIRWWSNYEDGDLGEPSGKQSARCKGEERGFWNRYHWNAVRNPFNMGKRTLPFFHCIIEECKINAWGDKVVTDKYKGGGGWQFTKATHLKTGKVYYGYYSVKQLPTGKVRVHKFGFKIKPSHAGIIQDADDKDKAFTYRYQHASEIN